MAFQLVHAQKWSGGLLKLILFPCRPYHVQLELSMGKPQEKSYQITTLEIGTKGGKMKIHDKTK